jgi:hypothetical protein
MNYDFEINTDALRVPPSAYRPVKRCPFCDSVFISDKSCEACGRSMLYHPVGDPFGPKSYYGLKERYVDSQNILVRFYPQLENKISVGAKSYVRNLSKRFADLISAFNSDSLMKNDERKFFFAESQEIIDELLRYGIAPEIIQLLLEENDNSLIGQELILYLQKARLEIFADNSWHCDFLNYRVCGLLTVEFLFKVAIITTTILIMAVEYKEIISSQFGK